MAKTIGAFFSLYLATLILLLSSGLFNTYLGLRLTGLSVSEVWVGAMIASYYLGLVLGARYAHRLIIRVGHIRTYAACAAAVTVTVLVMILMNDLWVWLGLRFIAGMAMVSLFVAIESWLNEQTENASRGTVFAFYMVATGLGTVLGQLVLGLFPRLDDGPLVFVAICSVLSLMPIALTRRVHPALQVPAPLAWRYYLSRVPLSLTVLFIAGMLNGAFYGLAPVYGLQQGMDNQQVGVFIAVSIAAGLVCQWPLGWLADRVSRVRLIRFGAMLLCLLGIPLWGWLHFPYPILILFAAVQGIVQFTLYPMGAAFANDNVARERRVGLSSLLYMVYGVGACIGPLLAGVLMRGWGSSLYFVFISGCSAVLVVFIRKQRVTGGHLSEDAPTQFVPMADTLQNSHVMAVLDPRVDIERDISHDPVGADALTPEAASAGKQ
ncbi:MAG: MFS transporter [Castellaniella sp.]|uniref:MFS transporter n=1 Tax=Castellaniella sp. TaxID=1955812 RepID=UPI0011FD7B25|nr:MFS transporter [Castellaniella sp.]TAN31100.1 MAG: MFS transporter [Castellaniella sp.]